MKKGKKGIEMKIRNWKYNLETSKQTTENRDQKLENIQILIRSQKLENIDQEFEYDKL